MAGIEHRERHPFADGMVAGAVAAIVSGVPSTAHALLTGADPWAATEAAGSMVLPNETRRVPLVAAAVPVHITLSCGWGVVLARCLPGRRTTLAGAVAGAAIGTFDLLVIGRAFERIRALPIGPQFADHIAFGAVAGAVIAARRRSRSERGGLHP
ncbi:MAG: hypothetical protein M3345_04175 [Actinomycetota bacterium]|nr:hypothetical protein [Actinomycetota bacterium]